MKKEDLAVLTAVIGELSNNVSVSGYENMGILVGCVNALREIVTKYQEVKEDG